MDPVFGFNPDLPDVSRELTATMYTDCLAGVGQLGLPGGFELTVTELDARGLPTEAWVLERLLHWGLVVEQLSESGEGTVLASWVDELADECPDPASDADVCADVVPVEDGRGCGCATPRGAPLAPLAALGLLGLRRRR